MLFGASVPPSMVIAGFASDQECPLCPLKRTSGASKLMSAMCQKRTFGLRSITSAMSAMGLSEVKRKGPLNPKGGAALANRSSTEDGSYPCQCSANGLARPPYVGTRFHLARLSTWSARKNQVKQSFVP